VIPEEIDRRVRLPRRSANHGVRNSRGQLDLALQPERSQQAHGLDNGILLAHKRNAARACERRRALPLVVARVPGPWVLGRWTRDPGLGFELRFRLAASGSGSSSSSWLPAPLLLLLESPAKRTSRSSSHDADPNAIRNIQINGIGVPGLRER